MARFVQIAMGSGAELSYHFLLARDLKFLQEREYGDLSDRLNEVMRMLSALSVKLKKPPSSEMVQAKS